MAEYIEREKALDAISEWLMKAIHPENMSSYNEGERAAYRTALSEIANIHAADVRRVVRGKWEESVDQLQANCSVCKTSFPCWRMWPANFCPQLRGEDGGKLMEFKRCPFCGSDRVYYTETEEQNYTDHVEGFIWCHGCNFTSDVFLDQEIAAEAWNRRARHERKTDL